jgi:hypothetical protein
MGQKDRETESLLERIGELEGELARVVDALAALTDPERGEAVHVGYWRNILVHPHGDGCHCDSCHRARLALAAIADANAILAEIPRSPGGRR